MASKTCSYVINSIHAILGLALFSGALWLYIEVSYITNLRNSNHYLLDYNLYWPQVIPWLFIIVAFLVIFVSCCGFLGAKRSSKSVVFTHIISISVTIFVSIAVAIIAIVFAESKSTETFIKDTIWDVYFQAKNNEDVADRFGTMEKRMQCCGAESPRDYINWRRDYFPQSCCDVYYHGWLEPYAIDCEITNKLANERFGCSIVATQYARIIIYVLSGLCILIGLIGIIVLTTSIRISKALRRPPRVNVVKYESESKKVLL